MKRIFIMLLMMLGIVGAKAQSEITLYQSDRVKTYLAKDEILNINGVLLFNIYIDYPSSKEFKEDWDPITVSCDYIITSWAYDKKKQYLYLISGEFIETGKEPVTNNGASTRFCDYPVVINMAKYPDGLGIYPIPLRGAVELVKEYSKFPFNKPLDVNSRMDLSELLQMSKGE